MNRYLHTVYLVIIGVLLLAGSSAIYAWYHKKGDIQTVYSPPNTIEKVKTVILPCKKVQVVEDMPGFMTKHPQIKDLLVSGDKITGEAELKPSDAGNTIISSINEEGKTHFIVIPKQRPLLSFENNKRLGLRVGYDSEVTKTVELFGLWEFARVGNVYTGIYGELNSDKQGKAMLEVSYHF
jgi:hypothetical protein